MQQAKFKSALSKISKLVNDVPIKTKPDYVLFPELSIPLRWLNSIAARLSSAGISIIAGTEYQHVGANKIYSEAPMILADNRLGYPTFEIDNPNLSQLLVRTKSLLVSFTSNGLIREIPKPVYIHNV